ncbi:MAG TPA: hypothetical protein VGI90_16170 [Steroidobacteraceae bacterium]
MYDHIFKIKLHLALRLGLPITPAGAIGRSAVVSQGWQYIKDHQFRCVILQDIVLAIFSGRFGPGLEYRAHGLMVLIFSHYPAFSYFGVC